jgi:hypothetical protein
MKTIEVLIPRSVKECTPDQLTKWMLMTEIIEGAKENLTKMLDFQVQLVSVFSGLSVNQVKKVHVDDVIDLSMNLLDMLNGYEYQEPQSELIIEGKKYLFEKDFAGYSTGQIIDLKLIEDVSQNPCEALAVCYIEEDMEYCQEDARGKIINPNKKREEIFKRSFPGDEFLNFFAFFFRLLEQRKLAIWGIKMARMKIEKEKINQELSETLSGLHGPR